MVLVMDKWADEHAGDDVMLLKQIRSQMDNITNNCHKKWKVVEMSLKTVFNETNVSIYTYFGIVCGILSAAAVIGIIVYLMKIGYCKS